jgi:metallo-beta-lactamase family protein
MKIKFLGGVEGVTGSKTLIEVGKESYLVDYGLYQGSSKTRSKNWDLYTNASSLTAVFLTHAHIDHSGLLPRLWKDGFRGTVYCTPETHKLCQILLADSAKIQDEDAKYANRKQYSRHKPALPLYSKEDVEGILTCFKSVDYNKVVTVSKHVEITFFWAGHIMGSSMVQVKLTNDKNVSRIVTFSGDVGHKRNILLKPPVPLPPTDVLVLESTYGKRLHSRIPAKELLGMYLKTILDRSGVAVIPSFSVGRTQDILYLIKELMDENKIKRVPVILDSPLSTKANDIFDGCFTSTCIKDEILQENSIYPETFREVESIDESIEVNQHKGPMIIVSASGMIDGGRVVHHVKNRIEDSRNGVILVGFQPEGTKGRLLIEGVKMLRLHKQELDVKASVFYVNALSAHGDYLDIIEWLKESEVKPALTILNHGETDSAEHMKLMMESQLDWLVTVAKQDEVFAVDYFEHE